MTDVKVGELDRWYLSLTVAPATVRRIDAVLAQVFEQCIRDGTIDRNPAALAHKPEARPRGKASLPVGTLNLILDAAAKRHPARGRALAFAALTGLRRGEMCGLLHTAVDHALGAVTVAQAVVVAQQRYVGPSAVLRDDGRTKATLKGPKAHQVVAIALGEQAAEIAQDQADWQRGQPGCTEDPFLWSWLAPFDEPLNPDTLTNWFSQAAKDVGVRGFTLHDLRHWQGSQVLEVGGTVQDAKERLRHKSLQTTMGYLHADHSKQLVLVNRMPRLELPSAAER
jgi:integrase